MKNSTKSCDENRVVVLDDALNFYLKKISKLPQLSQDEEISCVKLAQGGDIEARKKLINANLRLVLKIAKNNIHSSKIPFIDLIQEGNLGLMNAIDKFNPTLGFKFSTYATWWIRQAMFKAISEQSCGMKIPVYVQETLSKYKKTKSEMEKEIGHEVSQKEVSKKINISEDKIDTYLNAFTVALSIETHYEKNGEKNLSLSEIIEDKKIDILRPAISNELKRDISSVLNFLKIKEQDVIRQRFGLDNEEQQTLQEIGLKYGVTKECIRQIEKKALKKLSENNEVRELLYSYAF